MSTAKETLLFLAKFNAWRRDEKSDDKTIEMPDPVEIGASIDDAIHLLRRYDELERENAALRALLPEPYGFFTFGHKALSPWGKALDNWCERAKPLLEKKEAQP